MGTKEIELIENWLVKTIIGLNLCPFAKAPYEEGKVHILKTQIEDLEKTVKGELASYQAGIYSTSLILVEDAPKSFIDFYQITEELNEVFDGLQFVAFHPEFRFQGLKKEDLANYVNRSPLPLVHMLQSKDIEMALRSASQAEKISLYNEKILKSLGQAQLDEHFFYLQD